MGWEFTLALCDLLDEWTGPTRLRSNLAPFWCGPNAFPLRSPCCVNLSQGFNNSLLEATTEVDPRGWGGCGPGKHPPGEPRESTAHCQPLFCPTCPCPCLVCAAQGWPRRSGGLYFLYASPPTPPAAVLDVAATDFGRGSLSLPSLLGSFLERAHVGLRCHAAVASLLLPCRRE